jgi:hypothetical protein
MPKKPKLLESGQQLPHDAKTPVARAQTGRGGRSFSDGHKGHPGWGVGNWIPTARLET